MSLRTYAAILHDALTNVKGFRFRHKKWGRGPIKITAMQQFG